MHTVATICFYRPGPANTTAAVTAGLRRALDLGLARAVVATCGGETALVLHRLAGEMGFRGELVAVTHHVGFLQPGQDEMGREMRARLVGLGFTLVTGTHALSGPCRGIRHKLGGYSPVEAVAEALRLFGQGVKVCVECAVMAADAGAVPPGEDALVIAGTGRGADTACIIAPAHQNTFLDLAVREIVAKPRSWA
jgi:hypothetical protein